MEINLKKKQKKKLNLRTYMELKKQKKFKIIIIYYLKIINFISTTTIINNFYF